MRWILRILVFVIVIVVGVPLLIFLYFFASDMDQSMSGNLSFAEQPEFIENLIKAYSAKDFINNGFPDAQFYCFDYGRVSDAGRRAKLWAELHGIVVSYTSHRTPYNNLASFVVHNKNGSYKIAHNSTGLPGKQRPGINIGEKEFCQFANQK